MGTKDYNKILRKKRIIKHKKIRKKIFGTKECPRLCVFKSNKNLFVQIIDDVAGTTLVSASTLEKEIKSEIKNGGNVEAAKKIGEIIAKRAIEKSIKNVCFDRAGYKYHGRIKAVAEAARENGLVF
ncbi:MAG TPA: 50S ribosomal protein L18 [bacterium]|nr:50S ribosomal protein L18 [bacterium]HPQ20089.1 50S ribosomal protein L18 [bacterium]